MITTAETLRLLETIAAVHRRTSPRPQDAHDAEMIATVWQATCNHHDLDFPDLHAAVIARASTNPEAPEPAELIAAARRIRQDRLARNPDVLPPAAARVDALIRAREAAELGEAAGRPALGEGEKVPRDVKAMLARFGRGVDD